VSKLRIVLDTADVSRIKDAVSTGLIDAIATNPSKVAQAGKSYRQVVEEIRKFFEGLIMVQAVGETTEEICDCSRRLHQIDPLLMIKVTTNKIGLAAVKILVSEGIRTNATLIFNPTQALLAGLAGSTSVSIFVGRARMCGYDGIETIRKVRKLFDAFELMNTDIAACSIKDVEQVIDSIIAGAHTVAVPLNVFEAMCEHPLTNNGLDAFVKDYKTIPQS
jgi:transaldolase